MAKKKQKVSIIPKREEPNTFLGFKLNIQNINQCLTWPDMKPVNFKL
jgi:hypothetical protein